ncbi:MAG: hypothetical protein R3C59_01235 [Planctomycetaceae bacterium]
MKPVRFCARLAALYCFLAFLPPSLHAQPATDDSGGEDRVLTTPDNWPLRINYYESTGGKESPVVILFPGVEGKEDSMTRKVWSGVAKSLHQAGYAVVTADLRKHGDSVLTTADGEPDPRTVKLTTADYGLMAAVDLETIKAFLLEEHEKQKLNIRKLGIGTAGSGCMVAVAFAVNDWLKKPWADNAVFSLRTPKGQDVRAILMLSPNSSVRGLNTNALVKALPVPPQGVAVHIWYNPTISAEKKSAEKLFGLLEVKGSFADARKLNEGPADKEFSKEGLLQGKAKPLMEKHIVDFFDNGLRKVESPWATRKSRLE